MGNREIFERIASTYDTEERIRITGIIVAEIRRTLKDTSKKKAMDYGCGTGLIGLELLDLFDSMLFVDEATNMISEVRKKIERMEMNNADTLCADLSTYDKHDLNIDTIIMCQTLIHVPNTIYLLENLHGILNEHGDLIIIDFDKNERVRSDMVHNGFDQKELSKMLREIGFDQISSHTFHQGRNMFMGQDASLFLIHAKK